MMSLYLIMIIFRIIFHVVASYGLPIADEKDAVLYLEKFGYLEKSADNETSGKDKEELSTAIKDFQKFAGLNETGELDNQTISKMNAPRCDVKDKIRHYESPRKKRYVLEGSKWHKKELTYRINKYPSRITDKKIIRKEIARATKIWSNVTTITFKEKLRGPVDFDIRFEAGHHGDEFPFYGPGWFLAHASFPESDGAVHFDDEENWTFNTTSGMNLFQVAAHEFGHSLGIYHSDKEGALMAPYYPGYIEELQLHSDDIEAVQALYGSRDRPLPPDDENDVDLGPPPYTDIASDLCEDATIDTITRTKSGSTYVFKGDFYWQVHPDGIDERYPRKISDDWDGLEGNLDASATWTNGRTFFFKDRRYWRFTDKKMDRWYPKLISVGFKGIPDNLDAALVWDSQGRTYFFKGEKYWQYDMNTDPTVSRDYPLYTGHWSDLLTDGIHAAFQWENNSTYFFKGDQYFRYNDTASEVVSDPPYPLSTATEWFGCRPIYQNSTENTY